MTINVAREIWSGFEDFPSSRHPFQILELMKLALRLLLTKHLLEYFPWV
jgi:hypothetical protein